MKQLNKLLTVLLICTALGSQAQNRENKWLIGFGTHGPQMTIDDQSFWYEYFQAKNWNVQPAAAQIKVFRYAGGGLSLGTQLSLGTAKRFPTAGTDNSDFFLQWGMDIKYSFANGYILKQKCWFDPYLLIGGGLSKWGDVKGSINAGAGVNLWVVKNFGFFIQAQYNYLPHSRVRPADTDMRPSFMHHSFGIVARLGKGRDSDKDGVPDTEDKCPNDPGKPELGGCPDTDGDGVIDKDDKCPLAAGLAVYMGCPDSDGDGIIDPDDACPNKAGTVEMKGCPDTDGDGIADKDDKCPTVKGVASAQGCPDRDGDGVADADDACPDQKGPAANKGCPDSDGDGILDKDDKCPNVFGVAENSGCPKPALDQEERKVVQEKLNFAARNIFFESGKDILKKESTDDLDNVVGIMKKYDFLKLDVNGHTDASGNEASNLKLSQNRAAAVVKYLMDHGVTPTRLTSAGYGSSRPVADNKTAAGKAKNRRVEIVIKD